MPGPATASLWGRLSDENPGYDGDSKQQQACQLQQPPYQQPQDQYNQQPQGKVFQGLDFV